MDIGKLDTLVTLESQVAGVPTTDEGVTPTWVPLSPSTMWSAIEPAGTKRMEQFFAASIQATATHLVTMRYHPGVTTKTRLTWTDVGGAHTLHVTSVQNPPKRNVQLLLACTEVVA